MNNYSYDEKLRSDGSAVASHVLDENSAERLAEIVDMAPASLAMEMLPTDLAAPWTAPQLLPSAPACRSFSRTLRRDWRVASFTSLAGRREREEERPAHDEVIVPMADGPSPSPVVETPGTIRDFPGGAGPAPCCTPCSSSLISPPPRPPASPRWRNCCSRTVWRPICSFPSRRCSIKC